MQEYKYIKHSDKQRAFILEKAKELFLEQDIKDVSMSQIAQQSNLMRATVYRYFENRDAIAWEIYIDFNKQVNQMQQEKFKGNKLSTYEKMALFLQNMTDVFEQLPDYYKFFFHFSKEYLNNKLYPDTRYTKELYETTGLTSGSTVAFLMENFHDGSVREELDSKEFCVSLVYGTLGAIQIVNNNRDSLPLKYDLSASQVLKGILRGYLEAAKKDGYTSKLAQNLLK